MSISEMHSGIQAIEDNLTLYKETNFGERADAIDFIEFHLIDRIDGLLQNGEPAEKLEILKQYAGKIKCDLEKIDTNLFIKLRKKIRTGIYTGSSFKEMTHKYLGTQREDINQPAVIGYDTLDIFINGLLSDQSIPEPTVDRQPDMVFYQKTPARIILELIELADFREDDVFFDIGSGLGQVAILIKLISWVKTIGIEYEPAYCDYAKACAVQLNLSDIEFINIDARQTDYSQGNIFFMYTPFEGSMLQDMLEILKKESLKRAIRVFTYGPCSSRVAGQGWLNCVNGNPGTPYSLCDFWS